MGKWKFVVKLKCVSLSLRLCVVDDGISCGVSPQLRYNELTCMYICTHTLQFWGDIDVYQCISILFFELCFMHIYTGHLDISIHIERVNPILNTLNIWYYIHEMKLISYTCNRWIWYWIYQINFILDTLDKNDTSLYTYSSYFQNWYHIQRYNHSNKHKLAHI